ncbi:MAG: excisionase family DNA-binding protein [Microbacteriaceae bacterium]|nr:excisionase family DNA-binding protein [Microbacteriaceae bacterium]
MTATDFVELIKNIEAIDAENIPPSGASIVGPEDQKAFIPETLLDVLMKAAEYIAVGESVAVIPNSTKLSTQQAADILAISRPTFIKILESGAIPFETVGRHRRVVLNDLLTYKELAEKKRELALDELAKDTADNLDIEFTVHTIKRFRIGD